MRRELRMTRFAPGTLLMTLLVSVPVAALTLTGVQSRKVHGTSGTYDLSVSRAVAITGSITVEPRRGNGTHTIVFQFDEAITQAGSAVVTDISGTPTGSATTQALGNSVVVTLTNVADGRRATISLSGVNGSTNASVAIGFLVGDVNGTLSIDANDVKAIKAIAGKAVNLANFKFDVNTTGDINASDVSAVKARVGVSLGVSPPPSVSLGNVASAQVGAPSTLVATATAPAGVTISKVAFYEGITRLGEAALPPYTLGWTPFAEGPTVLSARAITSSGIFAASNPVNVGVAPHPAADAARLLTQATFGAPLAEISRVALMTPAAYLEEQFSVAQTPHLTTVRNDPFYPTEPYSVMMPSIWKQYFEAPDQLRQRVVTALSQIMVISLNNNTIGDQACGSASYLDLLGANAFGNFRNLLKDITLSPAMGEYLDMKGSAKADPALNSIPSENYARELMQLFSIGTVMIGIDGSVQLDSMGKPINTYSEATAQQVARALTGWNHAGQDQTKPWRWLYPDVPYPSEPVSAAKACTAWSLPMAPWTATYRSADDKRDIAGGAHDSNAKTLLTYPGSVGYSQNVPAGQTPMQDVDAVVDNLFNHPNVGPFIGEQLIKRMVTSNPNRSYVARVAGAFNNNGAGVRGDMKAVIRAILLDPEARAPRSTQANAFGKLREPILRFTHLHRAFGATMAGGSYRSIYDLGGSDSLGQSPLHAGSVFNFYHPDYTPSGPLAVAQLVGPEFEITNSATISGFMDFSKYGIIGGFNQSSTDPNTRLQPIYDSYIALASNPAAMIDAMNLTLLSAGMSVQFRSQLVDVVTRLTDSNATTQATERFKTALWLIMNSPEYSIQK